MTLDEAIARLEDDNVHEIILEPDQLLEWLTVLKTYIELQKKFGAIEYHYGFTSQANMLMEEAAEFTVALNKLRRGSQEEYNNIKEELADVLVVAQQLRLLLGPEDIDKIINEKVERQLNRIDEERTSMFSAGSLS
jgi:NTP pyrophosphatase (non-canonical NTP hydrolase)